MHKFAASGANLDANKRQKPIRLSFVQLSIMASFFAVFTRADSCGGDPEQPIESEPLTTAENCQYTLEQGTMLEIDGPPCTSRKFISAKEPSKRDFLRTTISTKVENLLEPRCVNEVGEEVAYEPGCEILTYAKNPDGHISSSDRWDTARPLALFAPMDAPIDMLTFHYQYLAPSPLWDGRDYGPCTLQCENEEHKCLSHYGEVGFGRLSTKEQLEEKRCFNARPLSNVGYGSFSVRIVPTERSTRVVEVTVEGKGMVTSEPAGLRCRGNNKENCRLSVAPKEGFVTLTAKPDSIDDDNGLPYPTTQRKIRWEVDCAHGGNHQEVRVPLKDYVRCHVVFKEDECDNTRPKAFFTIDDLSGLATIPANGTYELGHDREYTLNAVESTWLDSYEFDWRLPYGIERITTPERKGPPYRMTIRVLRSYIRDDIVLTLKNPVCPGIQDVAKARVCVGSCRD